MDGQGSKEKILFSEVCLVIFAAEELEITIIREVPEREGIEPLSATLTRSHRGSPASGL
jgi:hypothetical protein